MPKYEANIESLRQYTVPEWYKDAKLGIDEPLDWKQDYQGMHIAMPARRPCDHAYTFRIGLR